MSRVAMEDAVRRILEEHRLVPLGGRVLVAVSGGADSVALLHLLHRLAPRFPFTLHAAHLDHAIRPESPEDAAFVARLCAGLGVPLAVERVDVPALARARRQGVEEAGREARRDFLLRTAAEEGCAAIALGHHRGDQAETFLHRLLRGSALSGLAAMRLHSGPFIRPLLPFDRRQLRDYLAARKLDHREDPSNGDPRYTRNRLRHQILPRLQEVNPQVEAHFARLSGRIAVEEDFWSLEVERALARLSVRDGEGLWLDRSGTAALHPALRLRVLRGALGVVRGGLQGLSALHLEQVEGVLLGERPQAEVHLPGGWAGRRYERLWLRPAAPEAEPFDLSLPAPGRYLLPGGTLEVALVDAPLGEGPLAVEFAAAEVPFPLQVRTFAPGDRFRPSGAGGAKKLKDFFIDAKVEREVRRRLPLVVGPEILWLVGVRRCAGRYPGPGGARVLRLVFFPADGPTIRL